MEKSLLVLQTWAKSFNKFEFPHSFSTTRKLILQFFSKTGLSECMLFPSSFFPPADWSPPSSPLFPCLPSALLMVSSCFPATVACLGVRLWVSIKQSWLYQTLYKKKLYRIEWNEVTKRTSIDIVVLLQPESSHAAPVKSLTENFAF